MTMEASRIRLRLYLLVPVLLSLISLAALCNEGQTETSLMNTVPCQLSESAPSVCAPRATSNVNLFPVNIPSDAWQSASFDSGNEPSVEEMVEKGLYAAGAAPTHIAFQGPARQGSVRCSWRGVARTPQQREDSIKVWLGIDSADDLPSPSELMETFNFYIDMMHPSFQDAMRANFSSMAYGGLSTDALFLTCYVDYDVRGYILGDGPSIVTVAYDQMDESRSYELYKLSHAAGRYGPEPLKSESEYQSAMQFTVSEKEASIRNVVEGRESVVLLAPMGAHFAIAIEAWQTIAQWDLQLQDDGTVNAVRYGTGDYDPEHSQTLASLESRVQTAASGDAFAGKRIGNVDGLEGYYRGIGAYGDIGPFTDRPKRSPQLFTPAKPPPPYNQ